MLRLPDGLEYAHVVEGGPDKRPLELPEGWTLRSVQLEHALALHLPAPTTVFFFPNRDNFQGPVDLTPYELSTPAPASRGF